MKKAKKEYYQNLDEKNVIDNRKFWKAVKPLLSEKTAFRGKIRLKMKYTHFWIWNSRDFEQLSLQLYGSRDFEIGTGRQHGLFVLLRWVRPWIIFVRSLIIYLFIYLLKLYLPLLHKNSFR